MNSRWKDDEFSIQRGEARELCAEALRPLEKSVIGLFLTATDCSLDLTKYHPEQIVSYGTGILVEVDNRHFIATCGHILDGPSPRIFMSAEEPLYTLEGAMPKNGLLVGKEDEGSERVDVGLIEVLPEFFVERGRSFYKLNRNFPCLTEGERILFVIGHVGKYSSSSIVNRTQSGIWLPSSVQGLQQTVPKAVIPIFEVNEVFDGFFCCELDVYSLTESEETPIATGGCSGGPVFLAAACGAFEGNPDGFLLVGIQSHQVTSGSSSQLIFQTIERWLRFHDSVVEVSEGI